MVCTVYRFVTDTTVQIIDMEKLATGLEKLSQDDLLHVVQLIHDNKSEDTYTKNDVDSMSWLIIYWPLTHMHRWRIPCRPMHVTRSTHQDALGLCQQQSRLVAIDMQSLRIRWIAWLNQSAHVAILACI